MDFNTFPYKTFQTFSFSDPFYKLEMFNFQYSVTSNKTYQIKITPAVYIFMHNL